VESDGSPLWNETHANVPVAEGLFSVRLGSINALNTDLLGGDRWLGVQIGADPEMRPREKLNAVPYAMMAGKAEQATIADSGGPGFTVIDSYGSITLDKGRLKLQRQADSSGQASSVTLVDDSNDYSWHIIHRNNNLDFKFHTPSTGWPEMMRLYSNGDLWVDGSISHGALIENNLQTSDELSSNHIARFSKGDVLCWAEDRLELCAQAGDPLVQAVADDSGKPIVIGAEVIKALGPVRRGDLLVASDVPGYAMVDNDPQPGAVIAQALQDFDAEQGLIKAMIRKF